MNKGGKFVRKMIITTALTLCLSTQVHAITISPLPRIDMIDGMAKVHIDQDNSYWRADVYKVSTASGAEILEPAPDVVVAPKIFKAPRSVKIATKRQPDGSNEIFYRLVLSQQIKSDSVTNIQPKITISIPVVQAPTKISAAYVCEAGGMIRNTGNVHLKALLEDNQPVYVLPGSSRVVKSGSKNAESGQVLCPGLVPALVDSVGGEKNEG